jgi:hypothetical protein
LAIFVLVLWLATAAIGVTLLRLGGVQRRQRAEAARTEARVKTLVRTGAVPMTPEGRPPPGPHVRVTSPPGEHPLLEFSHPALAVTGIACWMMFTFVHYRPLAWIAFAVLIVTIGVGLSWLLRNRQAARQHAAAAWHFPPRLIAMHGLIAALTIALTVLSAVTAARS